MSCFCCGDRRPNARRTEWHIQMPDAKRPQRVDRCVHERGERAAAARFADAFRAECIGRRRYRMLVHFEMPQHTRARHEVIGEARGEELPGCAVVYRVLAENLAGALRNAAVHLACDERWVDDVPEI